MSRVSNPGGKTILAEGTVVRGYKLSYLATGGMCVVYRGTRQGRDYVLKEVPADQPRLVLALTQEKGILERIDHPQIVRLVTLFEEEGHYYLVVDFIDGLPLDQVYHRDHPLSEAQARAYGMQLCGIFSYLHGLTPPVIHRDVKPANILLQNDRVFLIDFGIARVHKGDRAGDTSAWGSFTAAPEQYGGAETDQRSDVYTLGATLYDLLVHKSLREEDPRRLPPLRDIRPDVSPQLEAALARAMAHAPEARYQTMLEFRSALGQSDQSQDTQELVRPAAAEPPPPKPTRRSPPLWAAGVLALGLAGMAFAPRSSAPPEEPDTGLPGAIFSSYEDKDKSTVVTLGSDIGLFRIGSGRQLVDQGRARELVDQLNKLYHEHCPTCGHLRLERGGFRVGRLRDAKKGIDSTVVFYSHFEPAPLNLYRSPVLLTTVEDGEASRQKTTKKFVAAYWRDLIEDMVAISRGESSSRSPLGGELRQEMLRVRGQLSPDSPGLEGLHRVIQEIGAARAEHLQHLFERVPRDYRFRGDQFQGIENYEPLL